MTMMATVMAEVAAAATAAEADAAVCCGGRGGVDGSGLRRRRT